MHRTVWLLVGLLLGAGGMWAYTTQVREPQVIAEATQAMRVALDEETLAKQSLVSGTLIEIDGGTLVLQVVHDIGEPSLVRIETDGATMVYQLKNDEQSTKEKVALSDIAIGSFITITLGETQNGNNSLYAKEIVKI